MAAVSKESPCRENKIARGGRWRNGYASLTFLLSPTEIADSMISNSFARAAALATVALANPLSPTDDPAPRSSFAEPAFSPDGREIVFTSGGDVWTVSAAGGEARILVSHPATDRRPMFSPDGSRLAFTSLRTGNGDVYVLTLATGDLTRITFDDSGDLLDGWSRDGKYLYFSSNSRDISGMNDVYRVSASGGTPMIVAGDRYASEYWSAAAPDGRTLAITARGRAFADWWRNGSSHIDESEIWLVSGIEPGSSNAPRYSQITQGGAKRVADVVSRRLDSLLRQRSKRNREYLGSIGIGRCATAADEVHIRPCFMAFDLVGWKIDCVRARF